MRPRPRLVPLTVRSGADEVRPRVRLGRLDCIAHALECHQNGGVYDDGAGLVLGAFMVDRAMEGLDATPGEKLFAVLETEKCLPDTLRVSARCTIGKNRLRVINAGRFAIVMNRPSTSSSSKGVRVAVDGVHLEAFPTRRAWFMHDRSSDRKTMTDRLFAEILGGGWRYLALERVRVRFDPKQKWSAGRCDYCGEPVPDTLLTNGACATCGDQRHYEPEPAV